MNSLSLGNPFCWGMGFVGWGGLCFSRTNCIQLITLPHKYYLATFAKTIFPKKRDQYGATRRTYTTGSDGGIT